MPATGVWESVTPAKAKTLADFGIEVREILPAPTLHGFDPDKFHVRIGGVDYNAFRSHIDVSAIETELLAILDRYGVTESESAIETRALQAYSLTPEFAEHAKADGETNVSRAKAKAYLARESVEFRQTLFGESHELAQESLASA